MTMRSPKSWCAEIAEPATLYPPWTSNEAFIRAIQDEALASTAAMCDKVRERATTMAAQRDREAKAYLEGIAEGAEETSKIIQSLITPTTEAKP